MSELETMLEMATTTGSIAIVPFGLVKGDASKKYGLEATRDKLKKASKKKKSSKSKKNVVMDPNTFSPVMMEYDFSSAVQSATELVNKYKTEDKGIDEIIELLIRNFDVSVIRKAIKEA